MKSFYRFLIFIFSNMFSTLFGTILAAVCILKGMEQRGVKTQYVKTERKTVKDEQRKDVKCGFQI